MDGFNNKFIKIVNDIKDGEVLIKDLDKYFKENNDKNIFKKCIVSLMDNKDEYVKIYAARYSLEYDIDKKASYNCARYILRCSKDNNCRIEAKYIYDRYKKRYISKITKILMRKKLKKS